MAKSIDYWTWNEISFAKWLEAANDRLMSVYLITLEDAGFSEEELRIHWEDKEAPYSFVEWFALKYDLDPKSAVWL